MTPRLLSLVMIMPMLLGVGCTVSDRDVSHDPRFRVGYLPGQVYCLKQPAGLRRLGDDYYELVSPGVAKAYGKPAGTLAAETLIRVVALRHTVTAAPIQWGSGVTTTAELVEPPPLIGLTLCGEATFHSCDDLRGYLCCCCGSRC